MNVSATNLTDATAAMGGGLVPVGDGTLGQEDFLQLLVTQLQAQDPLNPQDATEFTAQLAQFSSLEQLTNLNSAIDTLMTFQAAMANTQTASLIGHEVTAYGDEIRVSGGTISTAEFDLAGSADEVKVTIRDASGTVVRVLGLGAAEAGTHTVAWDGMDSSGTAVPDGTYTFEVEAKHGTDLVEVETLVHGVVEGVDFDTDGTFLVIGGRRVSLGDLLGVRLRSTQTGTGGGTA